MATKVGGRGSLVERTTWKLFLVASVQALEFQISMKWKTGILERIPTTVSVNTATYKPLIEECIAKCIVLQGFLTWE